MILRALYEYYQRSKDLAPEGFEQKEIPFLIVINEEGEFLEIEDMRYDKKRCKSFQVPKTVGRSSAPMTNTLWDNVEYVLNFTPRHQPPTKELTEKEAEKREKALDKSATKHGLFVARVKELTERFPENKTFRAVLKFYEQEQFERIQQDRLWTEIEKKPTVNLSFRVGNALEIAAEHEDLMTYLNQVDEAAIPKTEKDSAYLPICLITGERAQPVLTSTATMIPGSQATAKLVAFQVKSGYDSFGHAQGLNAPISTAAEFAYTTALNHLLRKGSPNKCYLGNRTFVFWTSTESEAAQAVEQGFNAFMGGFETEDDPNKNIEEVHKTLNAVYSGTIKSGLTDKFYFLGLAPNAARIAVVYWRECTLQEFAGHLLTHFEDMAITDNRQEKRPYCGVVQMLRSVSLNGKDDNIPPNLQEALFKSVIQGIPYPLTLQRACLGRLRATQEVSITRAAILKACLNRKRIMNTSNKKHITMGVDINYQDLGYLCGRLFASFEYAQEQSSGGKRTIRERYMNAASTAPASVMQTLFNLSIHHMEKLKAESTQIYIEKTINEILDKIPATGFPTHLTLQEQSRFFVGYYHQRQYLYTSKADKEKMASEENKETN